MAIGDNESGAIGAVNKYLDAAWQEHAILCVAIYRERIIAAVRTEERIYRERACAMRKEPDSDIDTILSLVNAANTCAALGLILEGVK